MSEASAAEVDKPAKKRKKKRKLQPVREGVPAFAQKFPRHPVLDALVEAFEQGDYARVRAEAPKLVQASSGKASEDAPSEAVRAAARELLRRIEPDPLAVYLWSIAVGLLVFLSAWYWLRGEP